MWGMIARITTVQGMRDAMISILRQSAASLPGCLTYIVAKDLTGENTLWVTEIWEASRVTTHP